jgi:hypothetical protein
VFSDVAMRLPADGALRRDVFPVHVRSARRRAWSIRGRLDRTAARVLANRRKRAGRKLQGTARPRGRKARGRKRRKQRARRIAKAKAKAKALAAKVKAMMHRHRMPRRLPGAPGAHQSSVYLGPMLPYEPSKGYFTPHTGRAFALDLYRCRCARARACVPACVRACVRVRVA